MRYFWVFICSVALWASPGLAQLNEINEWVMQEEDHSGTSDPVFLRTNDEDALEYRVQDIGFSLDSSGNVGMVYQDKLWSHPDPQYNGHVALFYTYAYNSGAYGHIKEPILVDTNGDPVVPAQYPSINGLGVYDIDMAYDPDGNPAVVLTDIATLASCTESLDDAISVSAWYVKRDPVTGWPPIVDTAGNVQPGWEKLICMECVRADGNPDNCFSPSDGNPLATLFGAILPQSIGFVDIEFDGYDAVVGLNIGYMLENNTPPHNFATRVYRKPNGSQLWNQEYYDRDLDRLTPTTRWDLDLEVNPSNGDVMVLQSVTYNSGTSTQQALELTNTTSGLGPQSFITHQGSQTKPNRRLQLTLDSLNQYKPQAAWDRPNGTVWHRRDWATGTPQRLVGQTNLMLGGMALDHRTSVSEGGSTYSRPYISIAQYATGSDAPEWSGRMWVVTANSSSAMTWDTSRGATWSEITSDTQANNYQISKKIRSTQIRRPRIVYYKAMLTNKYWVVPVQQRRLDINTVTLETTVEYQDSMVVGCSGSDKPGTPLNYAGDICVIVLMLAGLLAYRSRSGAEA